jgi:hypothetical protein
LRLTCPLYRFAVILYIQDAELAALYHQEPSFRHNTRRLPSVSSAELFTAPTAAAWAARYREMRNQQNEQASLLADYSELEADCESRVPTDRLHQPEMLNVYATLSGIGASICEFRQLDLLSSDLSGKLGADLVRWYTTTGTLSPPSNECRIPSDIPVSLKMLWHYTFISLTVDLNTLEVAVGREGPTRIIQSVHEYVESWISAPDSKRSLFHALYLQNMIVSTNVGSSTAIHTARVLFSAALCWYCYILYHPFMSTTTEMAVNKNSDNTLEYLIQLPEMRLLRMEGGSSGPNSSLWHKTMTTFQRLLVATSAEIKESTLCVLEAALRGLGVSGISKRFADIIYIFISGEMYG